MVLGIGTGMWRRRRASEIAAEENPQRRQLWLAFYMLVQHDCGLGFTSAVEDGPEYPAQRWFWTSVYRPDAIELGLAQKGEVRALRTTTFMNAEKSALRACINFYVVRGDEEVPLGTVTGRREKGVFTHMAWALIGKDGSCKPHIFEPRELEDAIGADGIRCAQTSDVLAALQEAADNAGLNSGAKPEPEVAAEPT